ncbi:MAG: WXG100 family type VII secretion target, partial [Actinobacteria bacterium]|nr:WXG100 family type VII secretion target [Actinomycetota bacterium]
MASHDEAEPPPPPPPPPITTSFDLWDPFGEPGELRAAADAWDEVADHLDQLRSRLGAAVLVDESGWTGRAADAFSSHWDAMAPEIANGAAGMREVADQLRAMADELEAKNDVVQSIYVMVAATAGVSVL